MREKIIETLFEAWSDGAYELKKFEPDYDTVFELISDHVDREIQRKIENKICSLVSDCERNAFMNGVYLCLELINGNGLK